MIDLGLAIWAEQGENKNKYHMILEETIEKLMAGHLLNRRLCRGCQHCKTPEG